MYHLRDFGSFFVGGEQLNVQSQPIISQAFTLGAAPLHIDENGDQQAGQMYVQYFVPQTLCQPNPLVLIPGGGLTGASFEQTPDQRASWLPFFIQAGWETYNTDAPGRGRSGWNRHHPSFAESPVFLPCHDPYERFRIGTGPGSYSTDECKRGDLNNQFPHKHYLDFMKQVVPRWTQADTLTESAYQQLFQQLGEREKSVVIAHSQGGLFAFRLAEKYPELFAALVLVEPTLTLEVAHPKRYDSLPILVLWGDDIVSGDRWDTHQKNVIRTLAKLSHVETVCLPERGITGNSHLPMMDHNCQQVAKFIDHWLNQKLNLSL